MINRGIHKEKLKKTTIVIFMNVLLAIMLVMAGVGCGNKNAAPLSDINTTRQSDNVDQANEPDDQFFIDLSVNADKSLLAVMMFQNPDWLKSEGIEPVQISKREDVYKVMAPYWDEEFVESIWKEGSELFPDRPFGFYTEVDGGLLHATDVKVKSRTGNVVVVSGMVKLSEDMPDLTERTMTLIKTMEGWKAVRMQDTPNNS